MNYIKEILNDKRVQFTFTVEGAEWENAVEKAYQSTKGKYQIGGFRKGKVPRKMLESMYGPGLFYEDAINDLIPDFYTKALIENKDVEPVDRPDVDVPEVSATKCVITATVVVKPDVILGAYEGLTLDKIDYPVKAADVDAELKLAQDKGSRLVPVEREAKLGDTLNLDYSGSVDGVKFAGGTAEGQTLELGSGTFIPGFEDQLVGAKAGDDVEVKVTFPENYHASELAGKEAIFACKVHEVQEKQIPELNDEFAKDVSEYDTLDEYKASIKKDLKDKNAARAKNEMQRNLIDKIVDDAIIDIPECMIDQQVEDTIRDMEYRLMYQYQGMRLEDYLGYTGMTMDGLRADMRPQAEKDVKTRLTLEAIIKAENLEVSDEEMDAKLSEMADRIGKPLDEYKKNIPAQQLDYIKSDVLYTKLVDLLMSKNKFAKAKSSK